MDDSPSNPPFSSGISSSSICFSVQRTQRTQRTRKLRLVFFRQCSVGLDWRISDAGDPFLPAIFSRTGHFVGYKQLSTALRERERERSLLKNAGWWLLAVASGAWCFYAYFLWFICFHSTFLECSHVHDVTLLVGGVGGGGGVGDVNVLGSCAHTWCYANVRSFVVGGVGGGGVGGGDVNVLGSCAHTWCYANVRVTVRRNCMVCFYWFALAQCCLSSLRLLEMFFFGNSFLFL